MDSIQMSLMKCWKRQSQIQFYDGRLGNTWERTVVVTRGKEKGKNNVLVFPSAPSPGEIHYTRLFAVDSSVVERGKKVVLHVRIGLQ
mmetsp:Transcript_16874/g.21444  ORF Transcript_16874/g.21444 Transcript_16874/m.21444 type:complete len:87 (-) Transcript_16874:35-295(-)